MTEIKRRLYEEFSLNKVLVIAPKKVAEDTWTREAAKWDHLRDLRISAVLGTEKQRRKALETEADIYIINRENVQWLVEHYGAKVILIHDAGNIGDCIEECVEVAAKMAEENPKVFVPQQFENQANPMVHRHHTGLEILEQVAGPIDGFCSGIGTGGTITGIGETLKALNPQIEIWAVEPENAAILAGGTVSTHIQMGIGDGVIPRVLNQQIYDDICIISDEDALRTAKDLAIKEGLMCGISSGTNVAAALRLAKKLGKGKTVVTVLPDTAERYFSSPLFE